MSDPGVRGQRYPISFAYSGANIETTHSVTVRMCTGRSTRFAKQLSSLDPAYI